MWPKRKILLLVPRVRDGWQGILSLLNALHREIVVRETSSDAIVDSADLMPSSLEEGLYDLSEVGPTEILYWPGIPLEDPYRKWGLSRGLMQTELTEFLHRYWEEEILLPMAQTESEEEPFLWRILDSAGYEPSLLWQSGDQWDVRIGNGLHWIIPETWLDSCWGNENFGRQPKLFMVGCCWVRQGERVEFYSDQNRYEFLGFLAPYKNKTQEERIYSLVLQALQLGVPWRSIRRAYDALLNTSDKMSTRENIRWYANDFTRDEWTGRAPIPTEQTEYVENRGVS